ncbi:hypothetical protein AYI70_g3705 [Smittium culicis]|uniref:Uncharacterized protein n=1 Tax=Smittium culicis TaxID=133412 RepID=A0A1R1XDF5_9FUNG|nr:hypothetical protein AYI70_g8964 [Smittium culicis]OMJ21061.1 hypothetical protein AYI70_g3705 [Smittium culicis]
MQVMTSTPKIYPETKKSIFDTSQFIEEKLNQQAARKHSRSTSHAFPSSDRESMGKILALLEGMEESYRSPMGTICDQVKVPNFLQYASSHGQAENPRSFSRAARILLKYIHRPKDEWRNTDGHHPKTSEPVDPRAAF